MTWTAGSVQNNDLLHEIILENPVVTCWKIVTQVFFTVQLLSNHMIDMESPGARFKSTLKIYESMLYYNLSRKFTKFQGAKVHGLSPTISNILILIFNRVDSGTECFTYFCRNHFNSLVTFKNANKL